MTFKINPLESQFFSHIHQIIRGSNTAFDAAKQLGICVLRLNDYLCHFFYKIRPLSYKLMKATPPMTLRDYFQDRYFQPFLLKEAPFSIQLSIQYAYKMAQMHTTVASLASALKYKVCSVQQYLDSLRLYGQPIDFATFRTLKKEDLVYCNVQRNPPLNCFLPKDLTDTINFSEIKTILQPEKKYVSDYSLFELQNTCIICNDEPAYIAQMLGTTAAQLSKHLKKYLFLGKPFSMTRMIQIASDPSSSALLYQTLGTSAYFDPMNTLPFNLDQINTIASIPQPTLDVYDQQPVPPIFFFQTQRHGFFSSPQPPNVEIDSPLPLETTRGFVS